MQSTLQTTPVRQARTIQHSHAMPFLPTLARIAGLLRAALNLFAEVEQMSAAARARYPLAD
jgi:hypothetical protein